VWNPHVPDVCRIWADTMLLSGIDQQFIREPLCPYTLYQNKWCLFPSIISDKW